MAKGLVVTTCKIIGLAYSESKFFLEFNDIIFLVVDDVHVDNETPMMRCECL